MTTGLIAIVPHDTGMQNGAAVGDTGLVSDAPLNSTRGVECCVINSLRGAEAMEPAYGGAFGVRHCKVRAVGGEIELELRTQLGPVLTLRMGQTLATEWALSVLGRAQESGRGGVRVAPARVARLPSEQVLMGLAAESAPVTDFLLSRANAVMLAMQLLDASDGPSGRSARRGVSARGAQKRRLAAPRLYPLNERQRAIVDRALASWFDVKAMQGAPKEECAEIMRLMQRFSSASMRSDA